ncbi:MAG: hypothetical protein JWN86_4295 [Planctomycetota bacterium]|nr:hypothetical protein [Planctomycetota bacterium]
MPTTDPWRDPRTWAAIVGAVIGLFGFVFGIFSAYWNRRESRLEALGKVLQPLMRAAHHLSKANKTRRSNEMLRASFPDAQAAKEAAERCKRFVEQYAECVKDAEKEFQLADSELEARSFRFPDKIEKRCRSAFGSLQEFSKLVNEGLFDMADVLFAKFRDDFTDVQAAGRGWTPANPCEWAKRRFKRTEEGPAHRFEFGKREMKAVTELVAKRASSQAQNTFAVHPPKKLMERPEIAASDAVVDELENCVFMVVFQDGTSKMLTFVELMVFVYQLSVLQYEVMQMQTTFAHIVTEEVKLEVKMKFAIDDVMRPELVKVLLRRIDFSSIACDELNRSRVSA